MKKLLGMMLVLICTLTLGAGLAVAKDEVLLKAMADLEKTYIPPLFHTSAGNLPLSQKSMAIYRAEWNEFAAAYSDYRADYANWAYYFERIERDIQAAEAIVASGVNLVSAHEELEDVRLTLLELRTRNGFPKFITDKLTAYHDPMEGIVLALKGKTPDQVDDALIASLGEMLDEAYFLFAKAESCPVDQALWGFTDQQMSDFTYYLNNERIALDTFAAAFYSGDKLAMIKTSMPIKLGFVSLYTTFGDFAAVLQ